MRARNWFHLTQVLSGRLVILQWISQVDLTAILNIQSYFKVWRKEKQVFLQLFNLPKRIVISLSTVEGLFSLLFY